MIQGKKYSTFAALAMLAAATSARAGAILVQNNSFEGPVVNTAFLPVSLSADHWTLTGPGPNVDFGQGAGPQNTGTSIFPNTAPSSPDHLSNMDGNQAADINTLTSNTFAQPLVDTSNANAPITFAAGNQYTITGAVATSSE